MSMNQDQGSVAEYISALKGSDIFGPQVVEHRVFQQTSEVPYRNHLPSSLSEMLEKLELRQLYTHQGQAINDILSKQNIVVATPTASGKSLIYNLPVLHELTLNRHSRALYLFPLKALAQDQLLHLKSMEKQLRTLDGMENRPFAAIYDGDTSAYFRKKIREHLPSILVTNPDMLHLSMLPYHDRWGHLFLDLKYVIIDEVHTYRGIFGSHVAWVLRRLKRLCSLYGSSPQFILSSATIGNPVELAEKLIDAPTTCITDSGAPRAARNILLLNPIESAASAATKLLESAIHRNLRTIVYTQSRKMTELITMWADKRLGARKGCIASYRAGFLAEDRRDIEQKLSDGSLLGVISTSALELGIDIGNLDICILLGYPGSMMATWQRAGRVGRGKRESLVILVGHEDALDQHFMRNPDDFFSRAIEPVVLNPENSHIARQQLVCAAAELPLTSNDPLLTDGRFTSLLDDLVADNRLMQSADGMTWFSARKYPQREVDLRGSGQRFHILEHSSRQPLGNIDGYRAFKECHPDAIYLHMAKTWLVNKLDIEAREILVAPVNPRYFTRVLSSKDTEIIEVQDSLAYGCTRVHFGLLRVTETITGYRKILSHNQRVIGRYPLDLPPNIFETQGLWIEIPEHIRKGAEAGSFHFMGGIHAMEHAMIGVMPLLVLCDRNDLGGISHPWQAQLQGAAVFVYDGIAGGMGLVHKAFKAMESFMDQTLKAVVDCPCESGCPSCIHSPKCGSGNRPIDKDACLFVLHALAAPSPSTRIAKPSSLPTSRHNHPARQHSVMLPANYGVFDVETQKSAQEVGGWHRADRMRISVAVLYDGKSDQFISFREENLDELIERLFGLDLVVGFNNKRFDNKVLSAYTDRSLATLPSLDILEEINTQLGYRLSLDRLAEKTLKVKKSSNGLQALKWFQQGRFDDLISYCSQDVVITRDLFLHGLRQRYLLFQNKAGKEVRLPVAFERTIAKLIKRSNLLP